MKPTSKYQKGIISVSSKGVGYVELALPEGTDPAAVAPDDIEIQPDRMHTAMHGDEVEIKNAPNDPRSPRPQGEVVRVITRAKMRFVGVIESEQGRFFLVPDDKRMYRDFEIVGAENGIDATKLPTETKALVEMTEWFDGKNPRAKVLQIIGKKGDNTAEMHSIVLEKGFDTSFPPEVEEEAKEIERTEKPIPAAEIAKRRDMRGTLTFTIDPYDAKDFDDAISFKKINADEAAEFGPEVKAAAAKGQTLYEIGVHIADVSHYVRPKTALDKEASKRAFSVYLVDRTIPMLPEVLSNDICSLNPNEDKAAFSSVFIMNDHGEVLHRWFGKTVINSDKRFTYETAQEVLNGKSQEHAEPLTILNKIAKKLADQKFANGAIDFEKDEVKFVLEPGTGKPLKVILKQRLDTHKLVEEYMLLANREVAIYIHQEASKKNHKSALLYRIHDVPDQEKLADLAIFIKALGYELESHDGKITSKAIRKMLDAITGAPQEALIKTATIRSMAKAVYSTENIGHFGLAFKHYAHFTSPIRRYPDLLVHRVLHHYLKGEKVPDNEIAQYERMATKSSQREIMAAEAERSSIKYKQVEYMMDKVGQEFEGTITGVTDWGIYIEEKDTKCEGMVKLRDIGDDFYSLDKKNYRLIGEQKKRMFSLGDKVKFKVMGADMEKKVLDYALVN